MARLLKRRYHCFLNHLDALHVLASFVDLIVLNKSTHRLLLRIAGWRLILWRRIAGTLLVIHVFIQDGLMLHDSSSIRGARWLLIRSLSMINFLFSIVIKRELHSIGGCDWATRLHFSDNLHHLIAVRGSRSLIRVYVLKLFSFNRCTYIIGDVPQFVESALLFELIW